MPQEQLPDDESPASEIRLKTFMTIGTLACTCVLGVAALGEFVQGSFTEGILFTAGSCVNAAITTLRYRRLRLLQELNSRQNEEDTV